MTAGSALETLPGLPDITACALLCPRATCTMGRGAKAMSRAAGGGSRVWSCETALQQPEHLQSHWLGGLFHFGTLLHIGVRTRGPMKTGFAGPHSVLQWQQCDLK